MKRAILILAALVAFPASAETKAGDVIQIITWTGGPNEENMREKRYSKPWKDLAMDATTRQKILQAEKLLEKETYEKFRVYALRVNPKTDGSTVIWNVLFISQLHMAAFNLRENKYCVFNLTGNGSMVSGTECTWL